jgi:3-hydroxyisobutyrate dehydrogenase-like beta-hydroxyacid dehydrogenase
MASLGYVARGAMGGLLAERPMARDHTVTGYNRIEVKAHWLLDKRMKWGDSLRAVAQASDATFVTVTNSRVRGDVDVGETGFRYRRCTSWRCPGRFEKLSTCH